MRVDLLIKLIYQLYRRDKRQNAHDLLGHNYFVYQRKTIRI